MVAFKNFYDVHYKKLLLIPFLILLISLLVIGNHWLTTGDFIEKGVTLKGGSTVTAQMQGAASEAIREALVQKLPSEDIALREITSAGVSSGIIVETTSLDTAAIKEVLLAYNPTSITVETVGPSLGESFFRQALFSILLAFVLMSIVVLFYFRSFIVSAYVILAVVCNIIFVWAMLILLHVKLSTAGIAAFLMIIGYSVDIDILLTTRVLKREGAVVDKIISAFETGIVMILAAMVATLVAYFVTPSEVLKQIMLILFFGLLADVWNAWLQNAGLLRMYIESKRKDT